MWPLLIAQQLAQPPPASECPDDMVHVRGTHYEEVQRLCLRTKWSKCLEFFPELVMLEPRATTIDACMDRYEWPNQKGALPVVMLRFTEAEEKCKSAGKRLCSEFEWELACEGARQSPWPYGWKQAPGACNSDKPYRAYDEAKINSDDVTVRSREVARLWQGAGSGEFPNCVSPFGVFDLVGNVEEWVTTSRPQWPYRSGLKGGYWSKPWSGCRGTNESHGVNFRYYEIGFRCCKDLPLSRDEGG
jgi:formylglycine-generating enzyme required for sulfatase activity